MSPAACACKVIAWAAWCCPTRKINVTDQHYLQAGIARFESSLSNKDLVQAIERQPDSDFANSYARPSSDVWHTRLKPQLLETALAAQRSAGQLQRHNQLLRFHRQFCRRHRPDGVATGSRHRATHPQPARVLGVALFLTVLVILAPSTSSGAVCWRRLSDLLNSASRIARGDFAARARHIGRDELGQVGQAFNFMAEELAGSYQELEQRVAKRPPN
jgi:two-component system, NarL family, nitrate/nitrite sensor histidine kinase NarX